VVPVRDQVMITTPTEVVALMMIMLTWHNHLL
jgi:hypothetical protein